MTGTTDDTAEAGAPATGHERVGEVPGEQELPWFLQVPALRAADTSHGRPGATAADLATRTTPARRRPPPPVQQAQPTDAEARRTTPARVPGPRRSPAPTSPAPRTPARPRPVPAASYVEPAEPERRLAVLRAADLALLLLALAVLIAVVAVLRGPA